jgi:hypothetical protein
MESPLRGDTHGGFYVQPMLMLNPLVTVAFAMLSVG